MAKRAKKALLPVADLVPIVGDAAIAGPVAEGVMIPRSRAPCRLPTGGRGSCGSRVSSAASRRDEQPSPE